MPPCSGSASNTSQWWPAQLEVVRRRHAGRPGADHGHACVRCRAPSATGSARGRRPRGPDRRSTDASRGWRWRCRPPRGGSASRTVRGRRARGWRGREATASGSASPPPSCPSVFCFRYPGMSTRVGHLNWHGGRQYASWSLKMSSRTMRRFSTTRSEWVVMTIPSSMALSRTRSGCRRALRPRPCRCGTRRTARAWARSTASGSRFRGPGRPGGWSVPPRPRPRRR